MMQVLQQHNQQVVVLEQEETFKIPTNCWAFVEEKDGKRTLVQELEVKGSVVPKLVLVPKVAGG